jgi:hypothetical protein
MSSKPTSGLFLEISFLMKHIRRSARHSDAPFLSRAYRPSLQPPLFARTIETSAPGRNSGWQHTTTLRLSALNEAISEYNGRGGSRLRFEDILRNR